MTLIDRPTRTLPVDACIAPTSSPVFPTGSRAYMLRAVLHDWDDVDARRILKRTAAAMKKGYSKLLVCDVNLPPEGAQRYQSISDFTMLHLCSSSDRTEKKWINLLRGADFDVVKIWRHPVSPDCIFEAELAGSGVKQTVENGDDEEAAVLVMGNDGW